ncbi:MAG: GNAT family N-acetyltransferase [Candidatus Eremiobacteraeota bacterium]|nr:GNAT family N-acetyltransferase [Candidatus Eremiobacteraeota bacterium]MBC5827889.1 GNAT family N-acetyltransferase [Candidatus Eremiobacteraeota bacterium]
MSGTESAFSGLPRGKIVDGVLYRDIAEQDWPTVLGLRADMVDEIDGFDIDPKHPGWRQRFVRFYRERLQDDRAAFFIAQAGPDTIGMATVYLLANHRSEIFGQQSAYISNVYVKPALRRKGIALQLTFMTVDWARSRGCIVARLRSSPMGRPLYVKAGFGPTEEMELGL